MQGTGGAGVVATNSTVSVNAGGTLAGGTGSTMGNAATFTSGANTLNLGGAINGNVAIQTGTLQINAAAGGSTLANSITGAGGVIQNSADTLTLAGANTFTGATTISQGTLALSGSGSIANSSGIANAGTFDISGTTAGASVSTLSGAGGTTLGAQTLTVTNGSTSYSGTIAGTGGVAVTGGTQTLTGANTYSGGTTIGATGSATSSTLQLGVATSAGTGPITFASMSGNATARLGLDVAAQPANNTTFSNTIANFGSGNELALAGLSNSSVSYNSANTSITVTGTRAGGGQVSENFVLSAPRTTSFAAVSDGNGGTVIRAAPATNPTTPARPAPCYVTGTRIRVLRGHTLQDVLVEHLRVGDLAITASGKPRPIRWIGSRGYAGLTAPKADCPVRINAGALAEGVPSRDLLVSPDHCLWLDGLFVAAGHLVNGTSITRGEAVRDLTYWHVELDAHDLLLAENTPAESFLPAPGVRVGFDGVQALDAGTAPLPYALRTELGPELAALRGRLARRAISSGEAADLGPMRAWLDRCVIGTDGLLHVGGWAQDAAQPDAAVCLDILVDGAVVAFTVASEYRADLATVGVGDGRVGFELGLDMPLAAGLPHVVEVRRSADGTLVCAKQVDAVGTWTALLAA
ncbi:Hint domain-containing protein [Methylobacterium sp. J-088]|uniref:Hint domain-containing protein n=1 Tax=Methylobacterium sp. J-088 TaxID=2836664 RepID=UPI001FB88BC5|nr:Hint domain-containing protein [Methylobacterium sp. J-088]MCJ2064377.1 Hint domain-containing protein [Methylobacterium sp. J-088]